MSIKKNAAIVRFADLDIGAQVERAKPFARELLTAGIEDLVKGPSESELTETVHELIGEDPCLSASDDHLDLLERSLWGALVLGVAYGLMLRPGAFDGGAR